MTTSRRTPTPAQIRLHHVLARRMQWPAAERRRFLQQHFGKSSSTQLTPEEISWVLDWQYHQLGYRSDAPAWTPGRLTDRQKRLLLTYVHRPVPPGWSVHPALSAKLLSRVAGRPIQSYDQLTRHEASNLIECLKSIYGRSPAPAEPDIGPGAAAATADRGGDPRPLPTG